MGILQAFVGHARQAFGSRMGPLEGEILTRKTISLSLVLLLTGSALADTKHTIKSGDSLAKIAKKYGISPRQLLNANPLNNPNKLRLGEELVIPVSSGKVAAKATKGVLNQPQANHQLYVVVAGDGEWTIARKLNTTAHLLRAANLGVDFKKLLPGTKLSIPGAKTTLAAKAGTAKSTVVAAAPVKVEPIQAVAIPEESEPGVAAAMVEPNPTPAVSVVVTDAESKYVEVVANSAILRDRASVDGKRVALIKEGVPAKLLNKKGSWCHLQFASGTTGWMRSDLLADSTPDKDRAYAEMGAKGFVAQKHSVQPKGEPAKKVFALAPSSKGGKSIDGLLRAAESMRGVRYSYGSMSRSATDCSGFTGQIFRSQGIKLPRTSYEQAKVGTAVAKSDLRPGDLVFFRTRGGRRVSHVGVYVGNGRFMHASTHGYRVTTDALSSSYYARTYAGARRVANFSSTKAVAMLNIDELETVQDVPEVTTDTSPAPVSGTDIPIK